MRKTLLSIMALSLSFWGGVNAQTRALGEGQEYLANPGATELSGNTAEWYESYVEWGVDIEAVYGKFSKEMLKDYIGYKIVGISVAGYFETTKTDCFLNAIDETSTDKDNPFTEHIRSITGATLKPSVKKPELYIWNDIMFDTPYTIPAEKTEDDAEGGDYLKDLYAGYSVKENGAIQTKTALIGKAENEDEYRFFIESKTNQNKYRMSGLDAGPLPVKLILEKTSTSINTTTTATTAKETGRYTMDGKRIYLPVRGINIVKMSDGTVRKVVNK